MSREGESWDSVVHAEGNLESWEVGCVIFNIYSYIYIFILIFICDFCFNPPVDGSQGKVFVKWQPKKHGGGGGGAGTAGTKARGILIVRAVGRARYIYLDRCRQNCYRVICNLVIGHPLREIPRPPQQGVHGKRRTIGRNIDKTTRINEARDTQQAAQGAPKRLHR